MLIHASSCPSFEGLTVFHQFSWAFKSLNLSIIFLIFIRFTSNQRQFIQFDDFLNVDLSSFLFHMSATFLSKRYSSFAKYLETWSIHKRAYYFTKHFFIDFLVSSSKKDALKCRKKFFFFSQLKNLRYFFCLFHHSI